MELKSTKFFKGDRGKNKENDCKARMDPHEQRLVYDLKVRKVRIRQSLPFRFDAIVF